MKQHRKNNQYIFFIIMIFLPLYVFAGYVSYGNDYLNLLRGPGGELYGVSYGLMQNGSENTLMNPAGLQTTSTKPLYLYHSTWFRNEVSASSIGYTFQYNNKPIGLMISRIGVEDIPDSRNALLDYGLDGIPGTGDTGEGNGQLDENEIIDYESIRFTGIANYSLHLGIPLMNVGAFQTGITFGLLYADLFETSGFGLTFDIYAQHLGQHIHSLYSIKNLPSAIMVFNSGSAQYYAPQINAAWLVPVDIKDFRLLPGITFNMSITENLDYYMFHIGSVIAIDLQPVIRIQYKERIAAGISYRYGDGIHAGIEFSLPLLDISYSFRPSINNDLGSSHLISLRLSADIFK